MPAMIILTHKLIPVISLCLVALLFHHNKRFKLLYDYTGTAF